MINLRYVLFAVSLVLAQSYITVPLSHLYSSVSTPQRHSLTATSAHPSHKGVPVRHGKSVLKKVVQAINRPLIDEGMAFSLSLKVAGIRYNLSIDTGSSDFFIKGENSEGKPTVRYVCGDACLNGCPKYRINYLDGPLNTYQKQLPVTLDNVTLSLVMLVAYQCSQNFVKSEGLIGLSFPDLAVNPAPTFLQTLINTNNIDRYSFGVSLFFNHPGNSFLTLGGFDPKHFIGTLQMIPLFSQSEYVIKIDGVSVVNGKIYRIKNALLDTGNTCISIPERIANSILQSFNVAGNSCTFTVEENAPMFSIMNCQVLDFAMLPNITIHINGGRFSVPPAAYLSACYKNSQRWDCDTFVESVRNNWLFLGDGFFNAFYAYFDLQGKQIGLALSTLKHTIKDLLTRVQ